MTPEKFILIAFLSINCCERGRPSLPRQIYVDPDTGQDTPLCLHSNNSSVACHSLDFAFSEMENSTAYLLKVPHRRYNLTTEISFTGMANLSFSGNGGIIVCVGEGVGLAFIDVFGIQFEGIALRNCAGRRNSSSRNFQPDNSAFLREFYVSLYFFNCADVIISDVAVTNSPNAAGVVMYDTGGKNVIEHSVFANNSVDRDHFGGGGFYVEFTYCPPGSQTCSDNAEDFNHVGIKFSEYTFTNVTFADNVAWGQNPNVSFLVPHGSYHESFGRGGGMCLYLNGNAIFNNLTFINCIFQNNIAQWGGGMILEFHDDAIGNTVSFNNCTFMDNECNFTLNSGTGGGGMRLGHYVFEIAKDIPTNTLRNNMVTFQHCNFSRNSAMYGGALSISPALQVINSYFVSPASVEISGVTFEHNIAKFGSALQIHRLPFGTTGKMLTVNLNDIFFINNSASYTKRLNTKNLAYTEGIGSVYINQFDLILKGSIVFSNNSGSGIAVAGSVLNITDCNLTFRYNTGYRGGAIILLGSSSLLINNNTSAYFLSNLAEVSGGAIYVRYIEVSTLLNCFIRHTSSFLHPGEWGARFTFVNNTDNNGHRGNSIHSTSVFPCAWTPGNGKLPDIDQLFCWPGWEYYRSKNQSSRVRNCSIEISSEIGNIEFLPNSSSHVSVVPGHEFTLPIQVRDDYENDLTGITVFSSTSNETNEYFWGGNASITGSNVSLTLRSVGDIIWRTELVVNLLQCPPGLYGEDCSCPEEETYRGILNCYPSSYNVSMKDQIWIGYLNDQYLIGLCPPGFCKQSSDSKIFLPQDPSLLAETVCEENRWGVLCGQCLSEHGPAVNSRKYKCVNCTNTSLTENIAKYVSVVYIPLTLLFVVIILFDIRLTTGPANGFILFSQMITTAFSLETYGLIPLNQITHGKYNLLESIYFIPYGIFHLEFIENLLPSFCISSSFSTLDILVLDYIVASFPLLMIIIITLSLKLKELRCCKCSRLTSIFRKVRFIKISDISQALLPAFASFLLLSYYKFSLSSVYLLSYQSLISKDGDDISTRVYYAGHIEWKNSTYVHKYFIPSMSISILLIFMALLLLRYPLLLLEKGLSKVKPLWHHYPVDKVHVFLDTFQGCYKNKFRFFPGLYFLFRLTISFTFILSSSWITQFVVQQLTCILMGTLISLLRPYKANYLNYVDTLIFTDLAMINTLSLYLNSRSQLGHDPPTALFALQYSLILLPLLYMIGFVFYVVVINRLRKNKLKVLVKLVGRKKYTQIQQLVLGNQDTVNETGLLSSQSAEEDLFIRAEEENQYCHASASGPLLDNQDSNTARIALLQDSTEYGTM